MNKSERKKIIKEIKKRDKHNEQAVKEVLTAVFRQDIFALKDLLGGVKKFNTGNYNLYTCINNFTRDDLDNKSKKANISQLAQVGVIKGATIEENHLQLMLGATQYIDVFPLNRKFKFLKNDKRLQTLDRQGKCHEGSLNTVLQLDTDNVIIQTGNISPLNEQFKHLHSWLELNVEGRDFVIDYTMNAMISKDGYYHIMQAEPLKTITRDQYVNDFEIMKPYLEKDKVEIKEYLLFPEDVINSFEPEKQQ